MVTYRSLQLVKFIYSEKATKFLRNLHLVLTGSKIFVAFSEYMNFNSIPIRGADYAHHIEISQQIFKQFRRACCCCCTHSTHSHNCILHSYSPVITKSTVKSNLFAVKNSAKNVQKIGKDSLTFSRLMYYIKPHTPKPNT